MILDEETLELRDMVREFVNNEIIPNAPEYEKKNEFAAPILDIAIDEMGLGCLCQPEEFGGAGLSNVAFLTLSEEIARGDLGIAPHCSATALRPIRFLLPEPMSRKSCGLTPLPRKSTPLSVSPSQTRALMRAEFRPPLYPTGMIIS